MKSSQFSKEYTYEPFREETCIRCGQMSTEPKKISTIRNLLKGSLVRNVCKQYPKCLPGNDPPTAMINTTTEIPN